MYQKSRFLVYLFSIYFALTFQLGASDTPSLVLSGVDSLHTQKIMENPDLVDMLESDNAEFNFIKIEQQLGDLLSVYGFFDALVTLTYNNDTQKYTANIDAGTQYKIASVAIDEPDSVFTPRYILKINKGDNFNGFKLIKAEQRILNFLGSQECRYIKRVKHSVTLNEDNKTVDIIFDVGVSPPSVFGTSTFAGMANVHTDVLNPLLDYETGDCYSEKHINDTVKNAINTNLFNTIYYEIDPQKKDETGIANVDVIYKIDERKHRTYQYGVGISDTEAVILSAGNEWRNLFQRGVSLNIQTRLSDRSQTLNFNSKYPSYFGFKQNLNSAVTFGRERFQTYNSDSISAFIGFEKLPDRKKFISYGIGLRNSFSKVTQENILSEDYFIAAVPLFALYDTRNDFLRPTQGNSLKLDLMPAVNMLSANSNFIKNQITGSHFINVGAVGNPQENAPTILAFRSTIGSILGAELNNIPITERFYAGGGGSVRGYNYQNLGETQFGRPKGGASLFETSLEARIGIKRNYGVVFFVDAGNVYNDITPQPQSLQFSAGIGGRYYSDIIPVRLDIGVPLNPRNNRNDSFGFYIGIGESF